MVPLIRITPVVAVATRIVERSITVVTVAGNRRIKKQIAFLTLLLEESRTPLKVNLQSNDLTDITLYKTGGLGHFLNKELSLIPGDYIVVGKRDGYRDVRVEFAVRAKQVTNTIIVQCEEKIALRR